jgi:hypothetical protein
MVLMSVDYAEKKITSAAQLVLEVSILSKVDF